MKSISPPSGALVVALTIVAVVWCAATAVLVAEDEIIERERPIASETSIGNTLRRLGSLLDEDEPLPSLFPLEPFDYLGFLLAIAGLMLAAGGGIGGGGILVPIYILIMEFPVKHAIPLASVTVLGGAIANNLLNTRKAHPLHPLRSCIDWDLILQMEPMTMAGALIGADLNDFLPDILLVVLLLTLLTVTAYKTLKKAFALYEKENEAMATENSERLLEDSSKTGYGSTLSTSRDEASKKLTRAETMEQEEYSEAATFAIVKLISLFLCVTLLNLFKGGVGDGGGPLGLAECGAKCFYATEAGMLILILFFGWMARNSLLDRIDHSVKIASDINWDTENTIKYPILSVMAGLVAGMFGIGGGIVKGPLMLALGVHPAVASATSAAMILFTSSTATVSYACFGLLIYDYGALCLAVGFFSTLVGQTVMVLLMKKYERHSYIAFSIGAVVALSAVCMTIESVVAISRN